MTKENEHQKIYCSDIDVDKVKLNYFQVVQI